MTETSVVALRTGLTPTFCDRQRDHQHLALISSAPAQIDRKTRVADEDLDANIAAAEMPGPTSGRDER